MTASKRKPLGLYAPPEPPAPTVIIHIHGGEFFKPAMDRAMANLVKAVRKKLREMDPWPSC